MLGLTVVLCHFLMKSQRCNYIDIPSLQIGDLVCLFSHKEHSLPTTLGESLIQLETLNSGMLKPCLTVMSMNHALSPAHVRAHTRALF